MMEPRTVFGALCAVLLLSGTPSLAADARLVTHRYNADEVVRIDGRAGVQASISFEKDEHIENVAIGDSNAWQVTPNKRADALFVKPLAASARTNLTVLTDRRAYYFDLVASPKAQPLYVLRFTYPDTPRQADNGPAPTLTGEEAQLAAGAAPADPAALHFGWKRSGKASLLPARIYDDGASVYVNWLAGAPVPAILIRDASGAEGPVNYAVRGDVIVIEGVPAEIVLRRGKDVARLQRSAPPAPAPARDVGARQALAEASAPKGN